MTPLGAVYSRVAGMRREWYARHPERRRRLPRPVISVGNLVVGGSGKTPVVAALAELLLREGERPAILSRGYRRRTPGDSVVVVSDGNGTIAPVRDSGDEPWMLAHLLPSVPVIVCARRYRAGQLAVSRFDATVLLLDDGFQHLELARDIDLLVVSPDDVQQQVLPSGPLRESLAAATVADAVLVPAAREAAVHLAGRLRVDRAFSIERRYEPVRGLSGKEQIPPVTGAVVVAVAGIARPQRFVGALRDLGMQVAQEIIFPDHHWFDESDVARIERAARQHRASFVMTTEKDAVRIGGLVTSVPWAVLPLRVVLTPEREFSAWIAERLRLARAAMPPAVEGSR